jgi:hypothetical protein
MIRSRRRGHGGFRPGAGAWCAADLQLERVGVVAQRDDRWVPGIAADSRQAVLQGAIGRKLDTRR